MPVTFPSMRIVVLWFVFSALTACSTAQTSSPDPLPSWSDGASKQAIVGFVEEVTREGSPTYVPPPERIAVFDNDGTLWIEQPMYTQLAFALERVRVLAPQHPEWQTQQPFKAVLEGDMQTVAASGTEGLLEIIAATHGGMTGDAFAETTEDWLAGARHPKYDRPYTELVYQPQLELIDYLRDEGFKVFIVSGGGVGFMRPWTERVYGIPPEQVVGSRMASEYRLVDGEPAIVRMPKMAFLDDKAGKPIAIYEQIGRRPILAFGNSDGDLEMLQYTTAGDGPRLGLLLHHTDAEREYAYDRESHFGRLDRALDMAAETGWVVVDMKEDWRTVFPEKPL